MQIILHFNFWHLPTHVLLVWNNSLTPYIETLSVFPSWLKLLLVVLILVSQWYLIRCNSSLVQHRNAAKQQAKDTDKKSSNNRAIERTIEGGQTWARPPSGPVMLLVVVDSPAIKLLFYVQTPGWDRQRSRTTKTTTKRLFDVKHNFSTN